MEEAAHITSAMATTLSNSAAYRTSVAEGTQTPTVIFVVMILNASKATTYLQKCFTCPFLAARTAMRCLLRITHFENDTWFYQMRQIFQAALPSDIHHIKSVEGRPYNRYNPTIEDGLKDELLQHFMRYVTSNLGTPDVTAIGYELEEAFREYDDSHRVSIDMLRINENTDETQFQVLK
jgi:hypothetical protein